MGQSPEGDCPRPHKARVKRDYHDGVDLGVQGTPTLFVNGECYRGRHNLDGIRVAVAEAAAAVVEG